MRPTGHSNTALPLRLVFWESTARCNLSCRHCRRLTDQSSDELQTEQIKRLMDEAMQLGPPIFVFSGGEPLLREDWQELAQYAKNISLPTALATNATLIDRQVAGQIAAAGFRRVSVSLDSATPSSHDKFRGQEGSFAAALAGADALVEQGIPIQFNTSVTTGNVQELESIYRLALEHKAVALHLFVLVPVGCGAEIPPHEQLTADKCEQVLQWVCDKTAQGPLEIKATCAPHYYRLAAQQGLAQPHSRGCLAGWSIAFISHTGQVFPCGYFPVSCGDVREDSLASIWHSSSVLKELRDVNLLKGKCGQCEYKRPCGGCRARAYGAGGDYLSAEPLCNYLPRQNHE